MLKKLAVLLLMVSVGAVSSCTKKYSDIKVSRASITLSNGANEDFDVIVGSSPEDNSQDYVIENVGTKEMTISSIKLSGTGSSAFTLDTKQFTSGTVSVGSTVTFNILLKTSTIGNYTAAVDIESDAKDNNSFKLNLTGSVHQ
jgi:hypothetical protein